MKYRRMSTILSATCLLMAGASVSAQETLPVGKTKADQQRNAALLKGYDYRQYDAGITGYTGQDRQQIVFERRSSAIRTRVGTRGNYKAGVTELADGKLILATCRNNNDPEPTKKRFLIHIFESMDRGLSWTEINKTPLYGKEPSLTSMPDGTLVMSAQKGYFGPGSKVNEVINLARSTDGGRTWERYDLPGADYPRKIIGETPLSGKEPSLTALPDGSVVLSAQKGYFGPGTKYKEEINLARSTDGGRTWERSVLRGSDLPRNMIVEPDGSLLFVRAVKSDWSGAGGGSPNLQLCRSADGMTWEFAEGVVDWDERAFGEVSAIRLRDGRLLAALRRQIPKTKGEGYEDTVITESSDNGKNWSTPFVFVNTAEVHVYLTELSDSRILATYSNYHLPFGAYAIVSADGGKTWDRDHPIRLAVSADLYVGWPLTLQLRDQSLLTAYALTAYLKQPPETTATEVVRWRLP